MANDSSQSQIEGLATLLVLDSEIKKINNLREFSFFATNETHRLISYHSAYLWQEKEFVGIHILGQSGTAEIDIHAPINQAVIDEIRKFKDSPNAKEIHAIDLTTADDNDDQPSKWDEALPPHALWCPLFDKNNALSGGLLYFRDRPFAENEIKMLRWLIASYQFTWLIISKPKVIPPWQKFRDKPYLVGGAIALTIFFLFPIHISVLGVGTVIPKTPILINAPLQGVIQSFAVNPGQLVKEGDLLLTIDPTDLQATADVNRKDLLLTETKLRTAINEGFANKEKISRAEIPIIKAQLEIDRSHLEYTNVMLKKTKIYSPAAGIVVFDGKEDWLGQPVQTGERILNIADAKNVALKVVVPVSDMIKLDTGAKGDFFLYGQLSTIPIRVTALGYNAKLMPNKVLAYQIRADLVNTSELPQLGSQGTVRIYGPRVPLIYYLLRKPLQAIRQTFGM